MPYIRECEKYPYFRLLAHCGTWSELRGESGSGTPVQTTEPIYFKALVCIRTVERRPKLQ